MLIMLCLKVNKSGLCNMDLIDVLCRHKIGQLQGCSRNYAQEGVGGNTFVSWGGQVL